MTFNSDGLTITNGTNTFIVNPNDEKLFRITKSSNDVLWADKNGNLNLTGNITGSSITGGKIYGTTINGSEVKSSSFIGGSINIGNGNFVVNSDGSVVSKGSLSFGNGLLTYNTTNGLSVKGNIYLNNALMMWHAEDEGGFEARYEKALSWMYTSDAWFLQVGGAGCWMNSLDVSNYIQCDFINASNDISCNNIDCRGSINGNSSTATKLKTPRTLTIGRAGRVFDGSDNIGWTLADIGAATQNEVNSLKSRIEALEGRINS